MWHGYITLCGDICMKLLRHIFSANIIPAPISMFGLAQRTLGHIRMYTVTLYSYVLIMLCADWWIELNQTVHYDTTRVEMLIWTIFFPWPKCSSLCCECYLENHTIEPTRFLCYYYIIPLQLNYFLSALVAVCYQSNSLSLQTQFAWFRLCGTMYYLVR